MPDLNIHEVSSGTKAFDWEIPDEWNIKEAYIEDQYGNRIIDFKNHNLYVVSYSIPIDTYLTQCIIENRFFELTDGLLEGQKSKDLGTNTVS